LKYRPTSKPNQIFISYLVGAPYASPLCVEKIRNYYKHYLDFNDMQSNDLKDSIFSSISKNKIIADILQQLELLWPWTKDFKTSSSVIYSLDQ
jgi:hypothetical protein